MRRLLSFFRELLASGPSPEDQLGVTVPETLCLDCDTIYLTFDDGPHPERTLRILDTLAAHDVKATFFVVGENIAGNEDILRRARDEGHIIANHQWVHEVAPSESLFRTWVTETRDRLHALVGDMPLYFRYPYGKATNWKQKLLRNDYGYADGGIGWHLDSCDWAYEVVAGSLASPEVRAKAVAFLPPAHGDDMAGHVVSCARERRGGVLLMHDDKHVTAECLDSLLAKLEDAGFQFGQFPLGER